MIVGIRYLTSLADIIKGYELSILQILEKYKVCDRDIDKVLEKIELIEKDTINLVLERKRLENEK